VRRVTVHDVAQVLPRCNVFFVLFPSALCTYLSGILTPQKRQNTAVQQMKNRIRHYQRHRGGSVPGTHLKEEVCVQGQRGQAEGGRRRQRVCAGHDMQRCRQTNVLLPGGGGSSETPIPSTRTNVLGCLYGLVPSVHGTPFLWRAASWSSRVTRSNISVTSWRNVAAAVLAINGS
jgi:hypothetical protein